MKKILCRKRKSAIPRLSDKEWEILKPLWKEGPLAARDIYSMVPKKYHWAYKTVKTMISRLVKKKALVYNQVGNSYLYRPAHSRPTMTRAALRCFFQKVFDGALHPFIDYFIENASPENIEDFKKELARMQKHKIPRAARRKPNLSNRN